MLKALRVCMYARAHVCVYARVCDNFSPLKNVPFTQHVKHEFV